MPSDLSPPVRQREDVTTPTSACPTCYRRLPTNPGHPFLPAGQHAALDPLRRRLWLVCDGCGEWTLLPVEGPALWAAAESMATSHDEGGPGRDSASVRVVRVPTGSWASYAAYRYATLPSYRRSFPWRTTVLSSLFISGAALLFVHFVAGMSVIALGTVVLGTAGTPLATERLNLRLRDLGDVRPEIRGRIADVHVLQSPGSPRGFKLRIRAESRGEGQFREQLWEMDDEDALLVLRFVLREAGREWRSDAGPVHEAVHQVEAAGGPRAFLGMTEQRVRSLCRGPLSVDRLSPALRYAIEVAATELEDDYLAATPTALVKRWRRAHDAVARSGTFPVPGS